MVGHRTKLEWSRCNFPGLGYCDNSVIVALFRGLMNSMTWKGSCGEGEQSDSIESLRGSLA